VAGLRINSHEIGFERDAVEVDVWAGSCARREAAEVHPLLLERPHLADDFSGRPGGSRSFVPGMGIGPNGHTLSDRLPARPWSRRSREISTIRARRQGLGKQGLQKPSSTLIRPMRRRAGRLMHANATAGRTAHALRAYKSLWGLAG